LTRGCCLDHDCKVSNDQHPVARLQDPDKFCASVEAEQQALRDKLVAATSRLPEVAISTDTKLKISEVPLCISPAPDDRLVLH
jgi:Mg-chelatase subunit ChlI